MHVGVLPLLGSLALGGPPSTPPTVPTTLATPGIALVSGHGHGHGLLPVPGLGAPGGVPAYGMGLPDRGPTYSAAVMMGEAPHPPAALPVPAPLVAAKFLPPEGVRVTAFPGTSLAHMSATP